MRTFLKLITFILCIALMTCVNAEAAVKKLTVISPPERTVFYEGIDWKYFNNDIYPCAGFDLSGLTVDCNGKSYCYQVESWGANMYCEPVNRNWVCGNNEIYIYVDDIEGYRASYNISLVPIEKFEIIQEPYKTTLVEGVDWHYSQYGDIILNEINLHGMKIKVTYADYHVEEFLYVQDKSNFTVEVPDETDSFSFGYNKMNICYCGKKVPLYFDIEPEKIVRISLGKNPDKISYEFSDDWKYRAGRPVADISLDGLSVYAVYNNEKAEEISYSDEPGRFRLCEGNVYNIGFSRCEFIFDGQFSEAFYIYLNAYGDVDGDGMINSSDALLIMRYCVGNRTLEENQKKYADVNDDGKINSADALAVLNRAVGNIRFFEAEI